MKTLEQFQKEVIKECRECGSCQSLIEHKNNCRDWYMDIVEEDAIEKYHKLEIVEEKSL